MHLFDTAGRMRKHVQALQSKLNGVKDNPNAKLTANHHALFIGDTFPENALILNNVESMADVSSKVLTGEFSLSKDTFIKELVQVYKDMPQERNIRGQTVMLIDLSSYDKLKLYLVTHLRGLANDANMSSKDVPKEMQEDMTDKVFTRTPETFGNRIQYITLPVEDKNAKEPSTFKEWISKVRFASTVVRHTPKEDSPVSVMPVTDIAASCKELIKTLDNIIKYKELWFKGVQTRLKYVAGLNDVAKDWTLRDVNLGLAFDTPEQLAAFQAKSPEEQAKEAAPGIAKFTKTAGDVAGGIMSIIGKQDGFEANVCKNLMRSCSDVIHYLSDCTQAHAGK
jgi:hypothetical protein